MIMDFFAFFDLSYRQWDAIADSYIPLLALLSVMHLVLYVLHGTHCFKAFIFQYLKQNFNTHYMHITVLDLGIRFDVY